LILLATGSELHLAMQAAEKLGPSVRAVSLPCFERFERQTAAYRDAVLPPDCARRLSIEAGVTQPWYRYVGRRGRAIGIDRFGLSAPGGTVLKTLGISVDALVEEGRALLAGA
jgi:transketolase